MRKSMPDSVSKAAVKFPLKTPSQTAELKSEGRTFESQVTKRDLL